MRKLRLLIVEDNTVWRDLLARHFAPRFDVHAVSTVAAAHDRLEHTDVMILDMKLPNGKGGDVIRAIRNESFIPIIACTGYAAEFQPTVNYRWIRWVEKPVTLAALDVLLAEATEYATKARDLREYIDRGPGGKS